MLKTIRKISLIICVMAIIISAILYHFKSPYWFNSAVVGAWLLFDNLSYSRKNKTTLDLLIQKNYKKILILYLVLLGTSLILEGIGSFSLRFWSYPKLWNLNPVPKLLTMNIIGFLFYPFILMSFRETYNFFKSLFKKGIFALLFSMFLGILIWETPNFLSKDWIYHISLINFEVAGINILVIIGWIILILVPVYIYRILKIK